MGNLAWEFLKAALRDPEPPLPYRIARWQEAGIVEPELKVWPTSPHLSSDWPPHSDLAFAVSNYKRFGSPSLDWIKLRFGYEPGTDIKPREWSHERHERFMRARFQREREKVTEQEKRIAQTLEHEKGVAAKLHPPGTALQTSVYVEDVKGKRRYLRTFHWTV